jgi:UDP-glucose 4-epimerase
MTGASFWVDTAFLELIFPRNFLPMESQSEYLTGLVLEVDRLSNSRMLRCSRSWRGISRIRKICDCCVHLVTTTLPFTSNENMMFDIESNLMGSVQLMKQAAKAKFKKLVYISSGGTVYGPSKSDKIAETHPTSPLSSYGITKLAVEKYLSLYQELHGLRSVALRLSNPFGERQRIKSLQGAVAVFVGAAVQDRELQIWGDGSVVRDYIYVTDVANAVLKALEYEGLEKVFNVGSGHGQSLLDVVKVVEETVGKKLKIVFQAGRSVDASRNVLDISKASELLRWTPEIDFPTGVQKMASWLDQELRR